MTQDDKSPPALTVGPAVGGSTHRGETAARGGIGAKMAATPRTQSPVRIEVRSNAPDRARLEEEPCTEEDTDKNGQRPE